MPALERWPDNEGGGTSNTVTTKWDGRSHDSANSLNLVFLVIVSLTQHND
jgi:hypothetical protein